MKVNGQDMEFREGMTVAELVEQKGYKIERVVVERNLVIVPKNEYETTKLEENDSIEVLSFVGGG